MATPKIDRMATEFIKRIPTTFKTVFTPGTETIPDSYLLPKAQIIDYINRALLKLFNLYWDSTQGKVSLFIRMFPELVRFSNTITTTAGNYTVANPYLDFKQIVGAVVDSSNLFIKVWETDRYTVALSGKYPQYTATVTEPAIIQVNKLLAVFPLASALSIKMQYIGIPVDPTTGNPFTQNGSYDSPFMDDWNNTIVDLAYNMFLEETHQTT